MGWQVFFPHFDNFENREEQLKNTLYIDNSPDSPPFTGMLCFVAKEAAPPYNGIGSFFEIQIMDWVFRFKPTWYLKKQANLPIEKGFYFVIKIIFILISVNHHFLSNQIYKSFHNLYYVPFCDNNCNIPLSVLCILQWNIVSVNNKIGIDNCSIPVLCTLCL